MLYKSFRSYEVIVEQEVKVGNLSTQEAHRLLESARKNYRERNYNKEAEKIEKGNTERSVLSL